MKEIKGIITPAITPIRDGKIDKEGIKNLVDYLHRINVSGIFPTGTTGSSPILSKELQKNVIKEFSEYKKENKLFLPGAGKNNIDETIEISKFSEDLGADALVIVTPYYMKMKQDSIYFYFESILKKIETPVVIYNIPQLTGNSIYPETVKKLSENYSQVIGIKDSSGDMSFFQDYILKMNTTKLKVFQGQDELLLSSLIIGASGGVCGTTNFTNFAVKVMDAFSNGEIEKAKKFQENLSKIKNFLNGKTFPQSYSFLFYKIIMNMDVTGTPPPLTELKDDEKSEIYEKIKNIL